MVRPAGLALLVTLLLGVAFSAASAQEQAPLRFSISESGQAIVTVGDLLSDEGLLETVHSGLPLRIRVLVQLWKDGFFDDQKGQHEWRASVIFDPLTRHYQLRAGDEADNELEVNTLEEAKGVLQRTLEVPLLPRQPGRYYYLASVEMETLSLSDLEELQRWLQGELAPAVAGEEDVKGALAKGFSRILIRALGLPARRFQVRSPVFRIEESEGGGADL